MKFLLDNNLPPLLARALHELSAPEGHTVIHLIEKFPRDTADIEWISVLKEEGGWAVVSQDQFSKSDLEKHQSERLMGGAALRVPWCFHSPGRFEQIKG